MKAKLTRFLWIAYCVLLLTACKTASTSVAAQNNSNKGEKEFQHYLDQKIQSWKGQPAPDFSVKTLNGKILELPDLKGKVVLLNFWFAACKPCQVEVSSLNELLAQYGDEGVLVIGACTDDWDEAEAFVEQKKVKYDVAPNSKELATKFQVTTYPTTFLIDQNGRVQEVFVGASDFDATHTYSEVKPHLERLLGRR